MPRDERTAVLNVCVAGATGWAGSAVARESGTPATYGYSPQFSRSAAGNDLGLVSGEQEWGVESPRPVDTTRWPELTCSWTTPRTRRLMAHVLLAIERGVIGRRRLLGARRGRLHQD
jgi:hypothetical protein